MFDVNNYDYDKSMLGKEYFDGTHDRECDEVMKMLDNVFETYDEVEIEEERIIGDLLVEKKKFIKIWRLIFQMIKISYYFFVNVRK